MKNVFCILVLFLFACETEVEKFDHINPQQPILTRSGIDSVLAQFEQASFNELDSNYITYTMSDGKFKNSLQKETYYILEGKDVFKYVVGTYRIRDFLAHDDYYTKNHQNYDANHKQYWLTDKKMLYMMLDLILKLEKDGYNPYGFKIRNSHRHPKLNVMAGGASKSQHIWGKAVDIEIKDINQDGIADQDDKSIVLAIMEDIVDNKGGLGKYPGSMNVHFDCRGHRARWDSY